MEYGARFTYINKSDEEGGICAVKLGPNFLRRKNDSYGTPISHNPLNRKTISNVN